MPPFLVYFGMVAIVAAVLSFSIARLPFGIGKLFQEVLGSWTLLLLFWFANVVLRALVSILHSPLHL